MRGIMPGKGDRFSNEACIAAGTEVFGKREQRPINDVAVGVARLGPFFRWEELEPLRPVAARMLSAKYPREQVAQRPHPVECNQQADRPLAYVARAPRSTAELFQTTRGQVMHQRVVGEPGKDGVQTVDLLTDRRAFGRDQAQGCTNARPEVAPGRF